MSSARQPRHAEADQLDREVLAVRDEPDVARVQGAVDHAERVRGGERGGDLVGDGQRLVEREALALADQRLQRAARDPLDDEERPPVGELAELEDLRRRARGAAG